MKQGEYLGVSSLGVQHPRAKEFLGADGSLWFCTASRCNPWCPLPQAPLQSVHAAGPGLTSAHPTLPRERPSSRGGVWPPDSHWGKIPFPGEKLPLPLHTDICVQEREQAPG